jgi:5-methylcytosine-specific restriction endonuclease McrA
MVRLAKDIAKARDDYTCVRCKKKVTKVNCQGSHIIPVSKSKLLQFDPDNIDTLCWHCHLSFWHKNPLEATAWFRSVDNDRYERLLKKANDPNTRSLKEFELTEIYNRLQIIYQQYVDNLQKR